MAALVRFGIPGSANKKVALSLAKEYAENYLGEHNTLSAVLKLRDVYLMTIAHYDEMGKAVNDYNRMHDQGQAQTEIMERLQNIYLPSTIGHLTNALEVESPTNLEEWLHAVKGAFRDELSNINIQIEFYKIKQLEGMI